MQLFSFNSNNLPFEKSKVKLNNNVIKSPYLLKLSKINEKINIPFLLKQLNNLLIDNSLNINLNINTISNLNIDLKKNISNNKPQKVNKKAIITYDTSQIDNYLSYILTQNDIDLKLDKNSNKNFFKYNNKKSTNYYTTNNSIVSRSSYLHYYNFNKLDLIKFDNFLNKNNQNYVNINLFNKLNQFNLYSFSSSFDSFFDYYNLFKNNITDIKNNNIILKNKITNNPYLFSLYQKHFVLSPSSIDLIESKINLLKKDQVFKYMFFAILFKNPDFLANYIADSIKYKKFGVLQQFLNSLVSNMNIIVLLFNENGIRLQGIRIDCSGRFNGIDRTRTINLNYGSLSFNKLDSNIVYGNDTSFTKYGSFGIKV